MNILLLVALLGSAAFASCDPLLYSSPYYASAALVAPTSYVPAVGPAVAPAVAPAFAPAYPYSAVQAYSYGQSYSIQDYLPAAPAAPAALTYEYPLPYAYAADWFYRR